MRTIITVKKKNGNQYKFNYICTCCQAGLWRQLLQINKLVINNL